MPAAAPSCHCARMIQRIVYYDQLMQMREEVTQRPTMARFI